MPRDRPGYLDGPGREPGSGLDGRLNRLPPGHPSSPRYRSGEQVPETKADPADGREAATRRPEWQEALARGTVERVGPGLVDERASQFSPRERRVADLLAGALAGADRRATVIVASAEGRLDAGLRRLSAAADHDRGKIAHRRR